MSDDLVDDELAIAVIGMAGRFPGADTVAGFWDLLAAGDDPFETVPVAEQRAAGVSETLLTDPSFVSVRKRFGDPALFDANYFGMTPAEAAATDPQQRFLLETAVHALEDAAIAPARFTGDIGVFLGLNHSDYLLRNVLHHEDVVRRLGWHRVLMGNDRGYTATQISYRLGLTGPSMAVDCACSSSLAAVHQACRALLDYETDAALAGGSCVKPSDLGYLHTEGGIGSPDGRCRPFSAAAAGTVFASGVGLVVLRRLTDAIGDGDRVLAVIRGSGMNNDGDRKSGYTAPSVAGQAELVARVHETAGVTGDQISYVEAHGTGTLLGDPIEMAALTEAFRQSTDLVGHCAVGSVKSNIGHLDSASGIAGLIKVVLALRHRTLPSTLWCDRTNPHIDFEHSPFRVVTRSRPWESPEPLRAGVSSFGIGGTNVHVLVEQAPKQAEPDHGDAEPVLLPFSAHTPASLDELERQLRGAVSIHDAVDIAFTLRRGRKRHEHRRALLWCPDGRITAIDGGMQGLPAYLLDFDANATSVAADLMSSSAAFRVALAGLGGRTDSTAVALACAAVWAEHGITPAAVLADRGSRLAAAVLAGALDRPAALSFLDDLDRGESAAVALQGVPVAALRIPWYDADGVQLCPAGEVPDLATILDGMVAAGPALPTHLEIVRLTSVAGVRDRAEAMLTGIGRCWVMGVTDLVVSTAGGRVLDLPPYPFDRQRHWLDRRGTTADTTSESAAPEDLLAAMRAVFADATGIAVVGADDDLFHLDGDSLLAQEIVAEVRRRWQVSVPFGTFLDEPTPATLARLVGETQTAQPRRESRPVALPMTPLQQRFLFLDEMDGAAESYNVPVLVELRGPLDIDRMREAVRAVVRRHDGLRSTYGMVNGEFVRLVDPHAAVDVPVVDVASDDDLRREVNALVATKIPLDRAPVLVARILRRAVDRHVVAVVLHHVCADAASSGILLRDLYAYYTDAEADLPSIEGLAAGHALDHAAWLESEAANEQVGFWLDALADAPTLLELPTERARTRARGFRGSTVEFMVPEPIASALRAIAAAEHTTLFTAVLASFTLLLHRVADSGDMVVGTPVSGRHEPETRHLIGNFVNTLPLRLRVDADESFRALVRRTRTHVTAAFDHQDVPFDVVARHMDREVDLSTMPVFQVLFNMLHKENTTATPPAGLDARPVPLDRAASPYELQFDWWVRDDGGLAVRLLYDADLFDRETVEAWAESFRVLAEGATRHADEPVHELAVATDESMARAAAALRGPVVEVPAKPVHAVFADRAREHPDRLAVTDDVTALTYGQLARISAGLAWLLADRGVGIGESVGIAMRRGTSLIVALLGVLRAGATPVPFDLGHPQLRLAAMAEDCAPRLVLCERAADAGFAAGAAAFELPDLSTLDADDVPGDDVDLEIGAYLTYTSGTTGRPKGIEFPHRALTNLIHWESKRFTAGLRWLQLASFGFDAAFHETFAALCSGGSLFVADEETKHDHDLLGEFVRRHSVQKAILPVSLLHALAARHRADPTPLASLRQVASTGEQLRLSDPVVELFERLPDCVLINNYGPAETHVVTSYRFRGRPRDWPRHAPIGRPIDNVVLALRGKDGNDVLAGSAGELMIGGVCVATGYLGLPELTGQKFTAQTFPGRPDARAYRSGDRVCLDRAGDLVFLGRRDQQVKIRGVRVELSEVELAVRRVPGVRDVALAVNGIEGDRRIDCYLVADEAAETVVARVREQLREALPAAMVPASLTVLDRLPVNANGKVDLERLPSAQALCPPAAIGDGLGGKVLEVFRQVLNRPSLGAGESFFDAGGHSLLVTKALHLLREELGVALTVREIYDRRTAAELAAMLEDRSTEAADVDQLPLDGPPETLPPGLAPLVRTPSLAHQKTFVLSVATRLALARLQRAIDEVVVRHPALLLRRGVEVTVAQSPLRVHEPAAEASPQWLYDREQEAIDPATEPLLRCAIVHTGEGTLLALTVHLLVLDSTSLAVICRSLAECYDGVTSSRSEDMGFLRYLTWRGGIAARGVQAHELWRQLLPPRANDASPAVTGDVRRETWAPSASLSRAVRAWAAEHGSTPFRVYLTACAIAFASHGEAQLAVALDGRPHSVLHDAVGGFANIVPVLLSTGGGAAETFRVAETVLDRIEQVRTVPYADLAASDPVLAAFVDLPAVFHHTYANGEFLEMAGSRVVGVNLDVLPSNQRLNLTVVESAGATRFELLRRGEEHSAVLDRFRSALYELLFETGGAP